MGNSTHTLRDLPMYIPQFTRNEVEPEQRYRADVLDLQRPMLELRSVATNQCRFTLRSRVNASILSGELASIDDDLASQANRIVQLCNQEDRLRITPQAAGYRIDLLDADGAVLGSSGFIASESLARATRKLIAIQACQARFDLV